MWPAGYVAWLRGVGGYDRPEEGTVIFYEIQCGADDRMCIGLLGFGKVKLEYEVGMKNNMGKLDKGIEDMTCENGLRCTLFFPTADINSTFGFGAQHHAGIIAPCCQKQHHHRQSYQ